MGLIDRILGREARSMPNGFESGTISTSASWDDWSRFFGMNEGKVQLPRVTVESALKVPAVFAATTFLSRSLAGLPIAVNRTVDGAEQHAGGDIEMLLNEAPNPEWTSFGWRQYMWQQIFTGGRGPTWIERTGLKPVALWPMDPSFTTTIRRGGRRFYRFDGREYPAADVIDVPFALAPNQLDVLAPIQQGEKAIALAIAMNDFAGQFFASGGIPPLSLEGPMPEGKDAFKRAMADIKRAIEHAKASGQAFFGMPPGHQLKAVGIDPEKGQMTEARLFQIQEIARLYQLPPVFLQDLSKGTFSNTEQQDLQLVKHLIGQWAKALEDELNLKLFGQRRRARLVKHNLDGLQRGDFKSRVEGLARSIQTAQLTPNEARELENRPKHPDGDKLLIQGATVPLGTPPLLPTPKNGDQANDDAADQQAA